MGRQHRRDFVPEAHEEAVASIVRAVEVLPIVSDRAFGKLVNAHPRGEGRTFSKAELIQGARRFAPKYGWDAATFAEKLRMKPVRTQSGVAPVTVLTKPFPCPGRCVFCPNDVRMPKSYLSMEPGAQRAAQLRFDPYAQMATRLAAFHLNGHVVDKVEVIVLGGTWSFYPEAYQRWFVKRCFDAMNDAGRDPTPSPADARSLDFVSIEGEVDGLAVGEGYNRVVGRFLESEQGGLQTDWEQSSWEELEVAHTRNEDARARCVGLVLETRPDHVTEEEVLRLRRLGATKIQIGIQSLDDEILRMNQRGHDVAAARSAVRLLREAGFKIHAHWMPNLYGSDPSRDLKDYARLFSDPDFRPDELKIYPCSLIETAELMTHYRSGAWRPYEQDELVELLAACMEQTPSYCRLTRIIRDIPSHDIVVGNKLSNLREYAASHLKKRGGQSHDIRAREIGSQSVDAADLRLDEVVYDTSVGEEHFLQLVTDGQHIAGFLRLSLPFARSFVSELGGAAVIREVHVYGMALSLGTRDDGRPQHLGLGRRLVDRAAAIAQARGFDSLAVISAIGTRGYYRGLGFQDGALYQHRKTS